MAPQWLVTWTITAQFSRFDSPKTLVFCPPVKKKCKKERERVSRHNAAEREGQDGFGCPEQRGHGQTEGRAQCHFLWKTWPELTLDGSPGVLACSHHLVPNLHFLSASHYCKRQMTLQRKKKIPQTNNLAEILQSILNFYCNRQDDTFKSTLVHVIFCIFSNKYCSFQDSLTNRNHSRTTQLYSFTQHLQTIILKHQISILEWFLKDHVTRKTNSNVTWCTHLSISLGLTYYEHNEALYWSTTSHSSEDLTKKSPC